MARCGVKDKRLISLRCIEHQKLHLHEFLLDLNESWCEVCHLRICHSPSLASKVVCHITRHYSTMTVQLALRSSFVLIPEVGEISGVSSSQENSFPAVIVIMKPNPIHSC